MKRNVAEKQWAMWADPLSHHQLFFPPLILILLSITGFSFKKLRKVHVKHGQYQYHWLFTSKIEKGSCKAWFNVEDITAVWEHISASSQRIMIIISAHLPKHQSPSSILPPSPVAFALQFPPLVIQTLACIVCLYCYPAREGSIKSITKLKLAAVTKRNAFAMFGFRWFRCNLLEWTCHDHHHNHRDHH